MADDGIRSILRGLGIEGDLVEHSAFAQLPHELAQGETPESVAWHAKTDIYVATELRILHFKTSVWSKKISSVTSYFYDDLISFQANTGFMSLGCTMVLKVGGVKQLTMKPETRQHFASTVRSHMPTHAIAEESQAPNHPPSQAPKPPPSQTPNPPSREAKKPKSNGKSGTKKVALFGCLSLIVLVALIATCMAVFSSGGSSDDEQSEQRQQQSEERQRQSEEERKGFHCLSAWDGNHNGLEALVRDNLNDPGSMETFETRIWPVVEGRHRIMMEFGARNIYGGMVRLTATGWIDNESCDATLTLIE